MKALKRTSSIGFSHALQQGTPPEHGDETIPAHETAAVNIMRGCFGGCTFCAITEHQAVQFLPVKSALQEVEDLNRLQGYKGVIGDLGPTANMYRMRCTRPEIEAAAAAHPVLSDHLQLLGTDHGPVKQLMQKVRDSDGGRWCTSLPESVWICQSRSGIHRRSGCHHVGGHLKVAPEHIDTTP